MSVFGLSVVARIWPELFAAEFKPQLKELYTFTFLFAFAYALVAIFEPVFFYTEGFSLSAIALYYAAHYILYIILLPLGGVFASRFGVERSISISLPLFVGYFVTLAGIHEYPNLVYVAVVLLTLHKIFYWPAFHANFSASGNGHNRGTELSILNFLRYGVGILGPLAGGFIAAFFGFPVLFFIAAVLVFVSSIPMLRTQDAVKIDKISYKDPWKVIRLRKNRSMVLSMIGWGENLVDLVFWPILMFIVLGSLEMMGIISSLTVAIMTGLTFFIGEMADKFSRRLIIRLHIPFMIGGYIMRAFIHTPITTFAADLVSRFAYAGVNLPTTYRLYSLAAQSNNTLTYMVSLELVLCITKAIVALVAAAIFFIFPLHIAFWIVFAIAGTLSLFYAKL